jgi:hypothetical protein
MRQWVQYEVVSLAIVLVVTIPVVLLGLPYFLLTFHAQH